jgi:hypothetical protein
VGILDSLRGGPEDTGSDSPGSGGGENSPDLSSLRQEIEKTRKPRSDRGRPRGSRNKSSQDSDVTQEEINKLFEAENWEALASLYFDTRFVMTGFEHFRLQDSERKRLAATMGTTMKVLLKIDPAYVAVIVFTVNFGGTIAAKEAMYSEHKRRTQPKRVPPPRSGEPIPAASRPA